MSREQRGRRQGAGKSAGREAGQLRSVPARRKYALLRHGSGGVYGNAVENANITLSIASY